MATVEESEKAFPAFSEIDWDKNAEWKDYLRKFDLGTARNLEAEENRLRLKWYRKTYDPSFTPYKTSTGSAAGGQSSSGAQASNGTGAGGTAAEANTSASDRAPSSPINK